MINTMLASRSHFSLGESTLTLDALIDEAVRVGAKAVALTDTMSVSGLIDFTNKCAKKDIKPIIGCRLRIVDDPTWRKVKVAGGPKPKTPPSFYLTWYVLSEKGLEALFRLLTLANSDARFYNEAKIGFDDLYNELASVTAEDVAVAFSDVYSVLGHDSAREIAHKIATHLSASNVFVSLSPIDTPYFDTLNARALEIAELWDLPLLVHRPVCYAAGGADVQEIHQAILRNTPMSEMWHWSNHVRDWHAMTSKELVAEVQNACKRLRDCRDIDKTGKQWMMGLENTQRLVDMVTYKWAKAPVSLPVMAADEDKAVLEECVKGWKTRFKSTVFGHTPDAAEQSTVYKQRLQYELKVLKDLKFAGYFLLVQDVVKAAKNKGILVGPGRGSVGGSLVAYLMGITDVDPIRFKLLFERFINPERADLPDADLDFASSRRHEVIEYLIDKYGTSRVAGISNYGQLKGSSALRDVSRMVGLPEHVYSCSKLVPKVHGQPADLKDTIDAVIVEGEEESKNPLYVPELATFAKTYKPVWDAALALEGVMRSLGRHAAGIVVGGCDLVERAVIERRSGEATICWDKRVVEEQGLVKMDILGLETLDIIDLAQRYIFKRHGKKIDTLTVALDDPEVLANFAAGKTTGVFQFESGGMKRLLKDLGRDGDLSFEDITAATALYRPGPMDSGMMDSFVLRKQGIEDVEYEHPVMADCLATTFGVMCYQEQVMQVSRDVAGFSLAEADKLRKAMGKKDPKLMAEYRDKFVDGCVRMGTLNAVDGGALFDKIEVFAGYGFNRSHSVEYSLISYQAMWLKTHYPVEFYAAALSLVKDEKLTGLIADAEATGVEVYPPDINHSTDQFEILTDIRLLIPFNRVKGISSNTANAIMEARKAGPFKSKDEFISRVERRKCNVGHQDKLDRVGAFASIEPSQLPARHPDRLSDQKELMPGLISRPVEIKRFMEIDKTTKTMLETIIADYSATTTGMVKPHLGKAAKFMVIVDSPSNGEEKLGQFAYGESFNYCQTALAECGLSRADAYWTGLIKRPKVGKMVEADEIAEFAPFLEREIETMKPPLILLLGTTVARHFLKDLKGNVFEHAGKVVYDKERDLNFVVGFSTGQVYFDPSKQQNLNDIFAQISEMI